MNERFPLPDLPQHYALSVAVFEGETLECWLIGKDTGLKEKLFRADQMHAYAEAARAPLLARIAELERAAEQQPRTSQPAGEEQRSVGARKWLYPLAGDRPAPSGKCNVLTLGGISMPGTFDERMHLAWEPLADTDRDKARITLEEMRKRGHLTYQTKYPVCPVAT